MDSLEQIEKEFYDKFCSDYGHPTKRNLLNTVDPSELIAFFRKHIEERDTEVSKIYDDRRDRIATLQNNVDTLQAKLEEAENTINEILMPQELGGGIISHFKDKLRTCKKRIEVLEAMERDVMNLTHPNIRMYRDLLDEAEKKIKDLENNPPISCPHNIQELQIKLAEAEKEIAKLKACDFWKDIIVKDGTLDVEQVKKEFEDYHFILEELPKVYCHITGGLLSKHMYPADKVIAVADDVVTKLCEEAVEEETKELKSLLEKAVSALKSMIYLSVCEDTADVKRVENAKQVLQEIRSGLK